MKLFEAIAHSPCNKAKTIYEAQGQIITIIVQERYDQQRPWLRTWLTSSGDEEPIKTGVDMQQWIAEIKKKCHLLVLFDQNHEEWVPIG